MKAENAALSQKGSRSLSNKYLHKKMRSLRRILFSSNKEHKQQRDHAPSDAAPYNNHPPRKNTPPAHQLRVASEEETSHDDSDESEFEGERFDFSRAPSQDRLAGTSAWTNQVTDPEARTFARLSLGGEADWDISGAPLPFHLTNARLSVFPT